MYVTELDKEAIKSILETVRMIHLPALAFYGRRCRRYNTGWRLHFNRRCGLARRWTTCNESGTDIYTGGDQILLLKNHLIKMSRLEAR